MANPLQQTPDSPSCGEILPPSSASVICVACLMRAALTPGSDLEPGEHVAGYEILEGPFAAARSDPRT